LRKGIFSVEGMLSSTTRIDSTGTSLAGARCESAFQLALVATLPSDELAKVCFALKRFIIESAESAETAAGTTYSPGCGRILSATMGSKAIVTVVAASLGGGMNGSRLLPISSHTFSTVGGKSYMLNVVAEQSARSVIKRSIAFDRGSEAPLQEEDLRQRTLGCCNAVNKKIKKTGTGE
jgi:hypothetical protein